MDLTKIFSGMDKGPEAIQANFEKLNAASGSGTEWSKAGLISLNGFGGNNLCWRKYKAGGLTILEFLVGVLRQLLNKDSGLILLRCQTISRTCSVRISHKPDISMAAPLVV